MKKLLLISLLFLSVESEARFAKMSDDAAKSKAIGLWSSHAATAKFWYAGAGGTWVYQVGCYDPVNGFHVTGQSFTSWEGAYAAVDPDKNGTFRITATATQTDGRKTTSPAINIYACDAVFDKNHANFAVAN